MESNFISCLQNIFIKTILYTALFALALLIGVVYFIPVAFTACSPNSWWCLIAYWFSNSGGPIGFLALLLITGLFYASTAQSIKEKAIVFFKAVFALVLFFAALAFLNENYTKHILKAQRPSHLYMLNQAGLNRSIDSLYQLEKENRKQYFSQLIKNNPLKFKQIDPDIQHHWIDEAGFSFPSGHTFNAFLFAMILAYAIRYNRGRPALRRLYVVPFLWAVSVGISRVAMGVHSALDVSVGAALGISIGFLFLYLDLTRFWLTRKN